MKNTIKPLFLLSAVALLTACNANKVLWTDAGYGVIREAAKRIISVPDYKIFNNLKFSGSASEEIIENADGYYNRIEKTTYEYRFDGVNKVFYCKRAANSKTTYTEGMGTDTTDSYVYEDYAYLDNKEGVIRFYKAYDSEGINELDKYVVCTPQEAVEAFENDDFESIDGYILNALFNSAVYNDVWGRYIYGMTGELSDDNETEFDWLLSGVENCSFKGSKISNDESRMKLHYTCDGAYVSGPYDVEFTSEVIDEYNKNVVISVSDEYKETGIYAIDEETKYDYLYSCSYKCSNEFKCDEIAIPDYETWKEIYK